MGRLTPHELARLSREAAAPVLLVEDMDPTAVCLRTAARSARFLGVFFGVLGCLPLGFAFLLKWGMGWMQLLVVFDTVVLVGPGAWYLVASWVLKKCHVGTMTATVRIALVQIAAIGVMVAGTAYWGGRQAPFLLIPTILSVFFVPALLAFAAQLRKAQLAMNALAPTASAFRLVVARSTNEERNG